MTDWTCSSVTSRKLREKLIPMAVADKLSFQDDTYERIVSTYTPCPVNPVAETIGFQTDGPDKGYLDGWRGTSFKYCGGRLSTASSFQLTMVKGK